MLDGSIDKPPKPSIFKEAGGVLSRLFGQRVGHARKEVHGEVGRTLTSAAADPLEREAWGRVKAEGILTEEVLAQTGDTNGLWELAFQFFTGGEFAKAEALLQRHFGETISPTVFEDIGDYLLSKAKFEEAVYAYRRAKAREKLNLIPTQLAAHYTRPKKSGDESHDVFYFQRIFRMIHDRLPSCDELTALGDSILAGGGMTILAHRVFQEALKDDNIPPDKKAGLHRRLGDIRMRWHLRSFPPGNSGYLMQIADHYRKAEHHAGLLQVVELELQTGRYSLKQIFSILEFCNVENPKAWIKQKAQQIPRVHRLRLFGLANMRDALVELGLECLEELRNGQGDEQTLEIARVCFSITKSQTELKGIGDLYWAREDIKHAYECYVAAGHEPDSPDYYESVGRYLCSVNDSGEAQKAFLRAIQLQKRI